MTSVMEYWGGLPDYLKNALYIVAFVFVLLKVIGWVQGAMASTSQADVRVTMQIKAAGRLAAQAEQDTSPLLAMQHANYAVAYLQLLKELYPMSMDANVTQLEQAIRQVQDRIHAKIGEVCPSMGPQSVLEAFSM